MNHASSYVYGDTADDAELARLRLLELAADADTQRIFNKLGVGAGWRCLEVAAGAGSVACSLAKRVGSTGHVVALDVDLRFLAGLDRPSLEVRRGDVLHDDLGPHRYDLVHTRHLLAHLGDRAGTAVDRMAAALRPGGWLVVEDIDVSLLLGSSSDPGIDLAAQEVFAGFRRLIVQRGGDPNIGRRLPLLLEEAGLVDVGVDARLPFVRAGDKRVPVSVATLTALRPMLEAAGVERTHVDTLLTGLAHDDHRGFEFVQVAAWARAPHGPLAQSFA